MELLYIPNLILLIIGAMFISTKLRITPPILYDGDFMSNQFTTAMKGIAMLMIMLGHCTGGFVGGRALTPFGGVGVSLFLIASGYGLNESFKKNGLNGFWKKRVLRVWVPYLIITLIFATFSWSSFKYIWRQLICLNCFYWFVPYVMECYAIFWFLSRYAGKYRILLMSFVGVSTLFWMQELQAEQALGFVSGVWMSENISNVKQRLKNRKYVYSMIMGLFFVGMTSLAFKQTLFMRELEGSWMYNSCQLLVKWPLSMMIIFFISQAHLLQKNPFIIFTGMISYELYLVHFRFYSLIRGELLLAIILISISYIVSWLFNKLNNLFFNFIQRK